MRTIPGIATIITIIAFILLRTWRKMDYEVLLPILVITFFYTFIILLFRSKRKNKQITKQHKKQI